MNYIPVSLFLFSMAVAQSALAQGSIKIGFVNTFSGPNAAIGIDERHGFEIALDQLGRKIGGLDVEVFYEDDQQKPEIGKQVTEKLIQSHRVDFLVGYTWGNVLLASLKPAVDSKTFIISGNAGPSQIAGPLCSPWFFSASWQNDQTPMALGEVMNQRKIETVYILSPNYIAGKEMVAGFKATYAGKVVGEEYTRWPGQFDFSAELSKVRAAKPDAVFVFYPGAAGVQFFTQYAQSGLRTEIPLYSVYTADQITLPQIKELALDTVSTQQWVQDLDNPVNKRFVSQFKQKYESYPSYYAAQHYDAAMLIASAVEAVKGNLSDKEGIRTALRQANGLNTRGTIRFNRNHFPIQNFYAQKVVKDEQGVITMQTIDVVYKDHADRYAEKCAMKW